MNQIFINPSDISGSEIRITGDAAHHIRNVLRMRIGEEIQAVCPETGFTYLCRIDEYTSDAVACLVTDMQNESIELPVGITIYQGMPKSDKLEYVIQKSVELGAVSIVPVMMKRSIVKLDEGRITKKLDRWNAIARSAAEQSRRSLIPTVHAPMTFDDALETAARDDAILLPYELASSSTDPADVMPEDGHVSAMDRTRQILKSLRERNVRTISVFIGPEGGFDESEVSRASDAGADVITLGRRILRTETAPIAILAWLTYIFEK